MRKAKPKKSKLLPDPKFNDPLVTRFVNSIMFRGKKNVAFKIFYEALDIIEESGKDIEGTPLEIWKKHWKILHLRLKLRVEESEVQHFRFPLK